MPAPKSPRAAKPAAAAKKAPARKPAAKKATATSKIAAAKKPAAKRAPAKKATAAKKAPAKKATGARGSAASREAAIRASLAQLREALADGVVLTAQRLQDAMDDAVRGGHMTRRSAEDLAKGLLDAGRKQTQDVIADVEQLLDRRRSDLGSATSVVRVRGDRVLREVDKVRRTAGIGPSFPILGFDDLTAAQVTARLGDLKAAELRKVRDYERRNANRKSVLAAIEKALPKS